MGTTGSGRASAAQSPQAHRAARAASSPQASRLAHSYAKDAAKQQRCSRPRSQRDQPSPLRPDAYHLRGTYKSTTSPASFFMLTDFGSDDTKIERVFPSLALRIWCELARRQVQLSVVPPFYWPPGAQDPGRHPERRWPGRGPCISLSHQLRRRPCRWNCMVVSTK